MASKEFRVAMKILSIHATANPAPPVNIRSSGKDASFLCTFLEQTEGKNNGDRSLVDDAAGNRDDTSIIAAEEGESGGNVSPESAGPDMASVSVEPGNLTAGVTEISQGPGDFAPGGAWIDIGASSNGAGRNLPVAQARSESSMYEETRPPSAAPRPGPDGAPLDAAPMIFERRETSRPRAGIMEESRILAADFTEGETAHRHAVVHWPDAGYAAREAIRTDRHRGPHEPEARMSRPVSEGQMQIGAASRTNAHVTFAGMSHQQAEQAPKAQQFLPIDGGEPTADWGRGQAEAATHRPDAPGRQSIPMPAAVSKGMLQKTLESESVAPPSDPVPVGKGDGATTKERGETVRPEAGKTFSPRSPKLTKLPLGGWIVPAVESGHHRQSISHDSVKGEGLAPGLVFDVPSIRDLPAPGNGLIKGSQTAGTTLLPVKSRENSALPGAVLPTIEKAAPPELIQRPETDSIPPATSESGGLTGAKPGAEPLAFKADAARMPIAQMVEIMARRSERAVEISLNPKELGKVRMSLAAADGGLTLLVVAERSETLDLMRRHIDTLAQEFRRMGYSDLGFEFSRSGNQPDSRGKSTRPDPPDRTESLNAVPEMTDPVRQPYVAESGLDLRI